ncbi:carbohydrate ABC transporter permease [Treponema bryantii]|uniref:carbohydrate ABC transporter permease n=1 Tax=Treponema bryantii TaxID=163 RepID=UPI0003B3F05F|nr:sugar ABC transporter permease [Treponema bryantii]
MKKKGKISYAKYGYIFSIPFVLAYLIFSLYPTLYTAIIGFTDLRGVGKTSWHFLKITNFFDNYKTILTLPTFHVALKNTIKLWVCNFIPQMILALLLSAWFTNRRVKVPGEGAFKVLFYMPNIITAATVAILFGALFGYPMGPVNDVLTRFHIIDKPYFFLQNKSVAQGIVMFIQTWMWYGYTMIIIISGVLGINPEIFEAADIDGANGWQVFWKITIPSIQTILLFTLVTSLIGGLNMFDIPNLFVRDSGPDNATLTTSVLIYTMAFKGGYMYNRASALSMIMFLIIVVCSAALFFSMRDKEEVRLKKLKKQEMKARKLAMKNEAKGVKNE